MPYDANAVVEELLPATSQVHEPGSTGTHSIVPEHTGMSPTSLSGVVMSLSSQAQSLQLTLLLVMMR